MKKEHCTCLDTDSGCPLHERPVAPAPTASADIETALVNHFGIADDGARKTYLHGMLEAYASSQSEKDAAEIERLSKERDEVLDILWRDIDDLRDPKLTVVQVAAKAANAIHWRNKSLEAAESKLSQLQLSNEEKAKKIYDLLHVMATDYEAKCADYERLRDALEKYGEHEGWCTRRWTRERGEVPCNCGLDDAISGLTPAAGSLEEADAPKAARKDKE